MFDKNDGLINIAVCITQHFFADGIEYMAYVMCVGYSRNKERQHDNQ